MEKKNMNTNAVEVTATPAPEVVAHNWHEKFETLTIGEYIDRVNGGEILNPKFQSGIRWNAKQSGRLIECLKAGRPVPPLMIVAVPTSDGGSIMLRVDGNQRTAAIQAAIEAADVDERETILAARITLQTVVAPSLEECGRLFLDLNNGAPLSGVQRQKVDLPEAVQGVVDDVQRAFASEIKRGGKYGKVNADTAAAIVLASLADIGKASTSSASAMKVLKTFTPSEKFKAGATSAITRTLAALRLLAADDARAEAAAKSAEAEAIEGGKEVSFVKYGNKGGAEALYWRSPAHLVPVVVHAARHMDDTPAEIATKMKDFNPAEKSAFTFSKPKGKGVEKVSTTIAAAWADGSNARAATRARIVSFAEFASAYYPEESVDTKDAEALASTVEALKEAAKA